MSETGSVAMTTTIFFPEAECVRSGAPFAGSGPEPLQRSSVPDQAAAAWRKERLLLISCICRKEISEDIPAISDETKVLFEC